MRRILEERVQIGSRDPRKELRRFLEAESEDRAPERPELPDFRVAPRALPSGRAHPGAVDLRKPVRVGSIFVGTSGEERFSWSVSAQPNAFLVIAGSSGSGKSELLRVLALELSQKKVPVILLDFHGDLVVRGVPRIRIGDRAGVNPLARTAGHEDALRALLRQAAPGLGHVQGALLGEVLSAVLAERRASLSDLRRALDAKASDPSLRQSIRGLQAALGDLFSDRVFAAPPIDLGSVLRDGAALDLSSVSPGGQILAAGSLLLQLFDVLRSHGPVPGGGLRCFVGLDEAAILKESPWVDRLAKEARKFGLGLAVATQEVRELSASLLANAASAAIFRTLSKAEATQAAHLLPGVHPEQLQALAPRGECIFRDSAGVRHVRVVPAKSPERQPASPRPPR